MTHVSPVLRLIPPEPRVPARRRSAPLPARGSEQETAAADAVQQVLQRWLGDIARRG